MPLIALMRTEDEPSAVGMPEMTPAFVSSVRPGGSGVSSAYVMVGLPLATKVCE